MEFIEYQQLALRTAQFKTGSLRALSYTTLGLTGEAGEVAERIKKILREDNRNLDEVISEKREAIIKEMGDVLWYLSALSREIGTTLDEIAQVNIEKLSNRKSRGVIYGEGDNR